MREKITANTVISCWIIFCILIVVHGFEAILIRTDETFWGENFINKLFGILVIFIVLKILQWKWPDIGFVQNGVVKSIGIGLALGAAAFTVAYFIEVLLLRGQGKAPGFGLFTTGFSLTGEAATHTGAGFILLCILFNIINVVMEEGTFRGLFHEITNTDHSFRFALLFQALLFGVWHIVTPLHNLIDGDIDAGTFVVLSIGYIILAGMMGIKWGLLRQMTGSLYAGMADHFFNNCIATNLLHVVTEDGIDELMIVRVLIAQILSFVAVLIFWKKCFIAKKRDDE